MWRTLISSAVVLAVLMVVYTVIRAHKLGPVKKLAEKSRALSWLAAFAVPAVLVLPFLAINVYSPVIVLFHLFMFWLLSDIIGFVVKKLSVLGRESEDSLAADSGGAEEQQKTAKKRPYIAGYVAIALTIVVMSFGWYNAHHISRTYYKEQTSKAVIEPVRAVLIADSHLGITMDGEKFAKEMQRIQAEAPDMVFLVGDFVDDDSTKEDMLAACKALGELKTTYGVFFVYGNHDNGYYRYRDFSSVELRAALTENGVTILEDTDVELPCNVTVVGRLDRSFPGRNNALALTKGLDHSKYIIMLDHQPNDTFNETASLADLVLSGHTHGGHIFPAGQVGLLMHANDMIYGSKVQIALSAPGEEHPTRFIVTSGLSGWAIPFKTGFKSEYVVIDIAPQ